MSDIINQFHLIFQVIEAETATYDTSEVLSDTGGALGLFLGLSVLSILRSLGDIYKKLPRKARFRKLKNAQAAQNNQKGYPTTPRFQEKTKQTNIESYIKNNL